MYKIIKSNYISRGELFTSTSAVIDGDREECDTLLKIAEEENIEVIEYKADCCSSSTDRYIFCSLFAAGYRLDSYKKADDGHIYFMSFKKTE